MGVPGAGGRLIPGPAAELADDVLGRAFFDRPVVDVAADLLGRHLVHESPQGRVVVRLTEVEAYGGEDDPGSHAARGRTPRTAVMFGPPGHLYVYFSYGLHWCANVVCGPEGTASAVLLRAGEVVEGRELARARRPAARSDRELARGPARLTRALAITGDHGGADLTTGAGPYLLRSPAPAPQAPVRGPRVGVSGAGGDGGRFPWRLHLAGEATVSAYRAAAPRRARGR